MALIKVNHQTIRQIASDIDKYCQTQDKEMRTADSAVKAFLSANWSGMDADAFSGRWEDVDGSNSIAVRFKQNLKNYADALRSSADAYQTAQEDSYNEASWLPKYLAW